METRAQQDDEQYRLLILEELAQRRRLARPVLRFRLLPWLMAVGYYQLSWLLYICWPAASYRLNAAFEDHAEHDYMLFVTEHPEWEAQPYDGLVPGRLPVTTGSLADLFRQIGHDERVHKLESLAALDEPRLRDARRCELSTQDRPVAKAGRAGLRTARMRRCRCSSLIADTGGGHRTAARAVGERLELAYAGRFAPVLCDPLGGPGSARLLRWVTGLHGPAVGWPRGCRGCGRITRPTCAPAMRAAAAHPAAGRRARSASALPP